MSTASNSAANFTSDVNFEDNYSPNYDAQFLLSFAKNAANPEVLRMLTSLTRAEKLAIFGELTMGLGVPDENLNAAIFMLIAHYLVQDINQSKLVHQSHVSMKQLPKSDPEPFDEQSGDIVNDPADDADDEAYETSETVGTELVETPLPTVDAAPVVDAEPVVDAAPVVDAEPVVDAAPVRLSYAKAVKPDVASPVISDVNERSVVKSKRRNNGYLEMSDKEKYAECQSNADPMPKSWKRSKTSGVHVLMRELIPQDFDPFLQEDEETKFKCDDGKVYKCQTPIGWHFVDFNNDKAIYQIHKDDWYYWIFHVKTGKVTVAKKAEDGTNYEQHPNEVVRSLLHYSLRKVDYVNRALRIN